MENSTNETSTGHRADRNGVFRLPCSRSKFGVKVLDFNCWNNDVSHCHVRGRHLNLHHSCANNCNSGMGHAGMDRRERLWRFTDCVVIIDLLPETG